MTKSTKDFDFDKYLEKLKRKVTKDMKTFVKSEKGQVRIKIDDENDLFEISMQSNTFNVAFEKNECRIYTNNSKSYIIAEQPNIRIMYRKTYIYIERHDRTYFVVTDHDIHIDERMQNIIKEKEVVSFYSNELAEMIVEKKHIKLEYDEEAIAENELLKSNNTLLISEEEGKVLLPYTAEELAEDIDTYAALTVPEIIEKRYTLPLKTFKNSIKARFKEGYNLMRYREKKSVREAIMLGLELMFESNLHPAIISACKTLQELDIYLDCLDDNELEKFSCFKIVYKAMPTIVKQNKMQAFEQ